MRQGGDGDGDCVNVAEETTVPMMETMHLDAPLLYSL